MHVNLLRKRNAGPELRTRLGTRGLDTDLYGETNEKDSSGPHSLWPAHRFRVSSREVGLLVKWVPVLELKKGTESGILSRKLLTTQGHFVRRVSFRSWWPRGRGGSSPLLGTICFTFLFFYSYTPLLPNS